MTADGLTRRFGDLVAVNNLTFEVPDGVVVGFVGPNGSRKSTTIRVLLGLIEASGGTGTVLGESIEQRIAPIAQSFRPSREDARDRLLLGGFFVLEAPRFADGGTESGSCRCDGTHNGPEREHVWVHACRPPVPPALRFDRRGDDVMYGAASLDRCDSICCPSCAARVAGVLLAPRRGELVVTVTARQRPSRP